jgi:hypothetical protein
MAHQNFQEAIEQLSTGEGVNPEEIKSKFYLNAEDMTAINSHNSLIRKAKSPLAIACCCCMQSDN